MNDSYKHLLVIMVMNDINNAASERQVTDVDLVLCSRWTSEIELKIKHSALRHHLHKSLISYL